MGAETQESRMSIAEMQGRDRARLWIIGSLAFCALVITIFLGMNGNSQFSKQMYFLIPHLYTIPLVLISLWYPRRGFFVVLLLVSSLLAFFGFLILSGLQIDPVLSLLNAGADMWVVIVLSLYISHRKAREFPRHRIEGEAANARKVEGEDQRPSLPVSMEQAVAEMDEIATYLEALRLPEERIREDAARALGNHSDPRAVDALVKALNDESRFVREEAARSLGKIGDRGTAQILVELLNDEFRRVREGAVSALGAMGEKSVEVLLGAMGDPRWRVRLGATIALRIVGDPAALEALVTALGDENRFVRREAAKSLGRIGDERAVAALVRALGDEDVTVRIRAESAIARITGKINYFKN